MKKSNRFLAVLLTLAMVFSMLPAGALAADPSSPLPKVEETAPTETPKAETPTETPAAPETPKAETPTETPAAPETPKAETPTETPAAPETPKAETPTETPAAPETPKAETPTETPKVETPTETPKVETPTAPIAPMGPAGNTRANTTPGWNAAGTIYTPTSIVNGSFEDTHNYCEPWHSDSGNLEFAAYNHSAYFSNPSKADGDTMAELCGSLAATTIYQDIITVPGEVIHWSLQHRTRDTTSRDADQMDVIFGKTSDGLTNGQVQKSCTANEPSNPIWVTHDGNYVVPVGQTSTRFYFKSTHTTSLGSGNLIDDVKFQTLLSAPYVSATTTDVKVRIYCTLGSAPKMYFQAGVGHDAGTEFTASKAGNYLDGTIPFASLPGGTDKITVWAEGYADFAQTVTLPTPTPCYVKSTGDDAANGTYAHPHKTIDHAYSQTATGGEIRVLDDNSAFTTSTGFGAAKDITITSYTDETTVKSGGWTLKRSGTNDAALLTVSNGSLTLNNIILDGNSPTDANTQPLINVGSGTTLTLDTGATLQNNKHTNASDTANGGAIVTAGTVVMNTGSTIKDNETKTYGGGVFVDGSGSFTMNGGTISGNKAATGATPAGDASGGGICIKPDGAGIVTINGGSITGNFCEANGSAIHGGGEKSKIILNGGSITGNKSRENAATTCAGGAVYPHKSTVSVGGGLIIKDNDAKEAATYKNLTSNLYLGKVTTATTIHISSRLTGTIGVSCAAATATAGDVTDHSAVKDDIAHFTSDFDTLRPYLDNGDQIRLREPLTDTYVSSKGSDAKSNGTSAWPYSTLAMAYSQVKDTGGTIHVMDNLTVPTTTFATTGKTVTIEGNNNTVHTLTRAGSGAVNMLHVTDGTITLKNIKITDPTGINFTSAPVCITTGKLVMDTGSSITGTNSNFAAVYMFGGNMEMKDGSTIKDNKNLGASIGGETVTGAGGGVYVSDTAVLTMTGGTITGNTTAAADGGGGVYVAGAGATAALNLAGNVKITGNTSNGAACNVYLPEDNSNKLKVTGNLTADARIGVSGIDGVMDQAGAFGKTTETAANVSNIMQDKADPLMATHDSTTKTDLVWAPADTNWLDQVAADNYGWNDGGGGNQVPDGIIIDTPSKLYSLAYAIANGYTTSSHTFTTTDGTAATGDGEAELYANGFYDLIANLDMSSFKWIPIGTTANPFTGVFEGYPSAQTITGISYQANVLFGLFGEVAAPGDRTGSWHDIWKTTLIQNIIVDGGSKTWTSVAATHMGGIAGKATDATIQNCSVRNFTKINILNMVAPVFVGGIVGETNACKLLNNSVGQTGAAMTLIADAGNGVGTLSSHAGGIVGKATGTEISGNTVGGNNAHRVTITADSSNDTTAGNYAGGVAGYLDGGSIANETYAHLNAMTVSAISSANTAYAGGVVGYMANAATMTNCTPGANSGEKHSITAQGWDGATSGKNYAGGLVGGMSGSSKITNSTVGSDAPANYKVTAGAGVESFAGGLVGDAEDARMLQCNAQSVAVTGNLSGGIAGQFTAANLATDATDAPGVMALCYARNCELTGVGTTPHYGSLVENAENATLLGCYATMPQHSNGVYGFKRAAGAKLVGCYSAGGTAERLVFDHNAEDYATYENCYYITATGTADAADTDTVVGLTAQKMASSVTLPQVMSEALQTGYNNMTGSLRMSYMPGNSPEINGNYNYPIYAAWMLTVNTAPGSVYGSYTVTADGKTISAPGATGLNQYWVGKGANIAVTGTPDGIYATAAAAISNNNGVISTIAKDETVTVTFTPVKLPGWTINGDLSGVTTAPYEGVVSGALTATAEKLTGNTVKSWIKTAGDLSSPWAANTRTIKTIFVTASTDKGYNNPNIKAFTADGWTVVTGGLNKNFVQLTSDVGMTADQVAAVINSFTFAATKPEGGDVTVNVQVYVDENVRGAMYFNGSSVYELAGTPASYASAKLLAETSTFGDKQGHLVVIGDSAEHQFLVNNVKTNAWTAALSAGDNTKLTNWSWDVAGASDASYLQNQSSWQGGEPNKSGTYATYNYGGRLDDTNGANLALIEYDSLSGAAADWQADSALSTGTVTLSFAYPPTYPEPEPPKKPLKPGEVKPVDPRKNGVSKLLEADKHIVYFVGDGSGKFNPEKGITRAETAQIFYNLLKNKNVEQTVRFQDVEAKAWYAQAVNTLASLKIIEGRGHNYFDPMAYISRAEFTAIAMRFADSIKGTFTYTDVPADYWAESAISGAAQYGWIMGYADGSFKPLENIKRAEAAKIVNTMLWRFPDTKFIDKAEGLKTFPDLAKGNWAYYDVVEATNAHEFAQTKTGAETWKK